jgi:cytochrome c-type biogenesis protein CcmH/NrfG
MAEKKNQILIVFLVVLGIIVVVVINFMIRSYEKESLPEQPAQTVKEEEPLPEPENSEPQTERRAVEYDLPAGNGPLLQ